jgi:hypothetical protein
MKPSNRLDADESAFFQRQLEFIKPKAYDVKYAKLKARELIPVSSDAGEGADKITYRQYDQVGVARVISSYANDLPRADVTGKEFTVLVKTLGASYGYSIQEIRKAKMAGLPLDQKRAMAARRAIADLENRIAFNGDTESALGGLLSNASVSTVTIPNDGSGSSKLWSTKTGDQIIRDMMLVSNTIVSNTKGVEIPDTLLLPVEQYNLAHSTPRSTASDYSCAKWFKENSPFIKNIEWVNELDSGGATDVILAYRKDPEVLTLEIPSDFEMLEPEKRNLEYVVDCVENIGGVIIYYPLAICKGDGI